jgi:tetratricopeptide (TPR) repeat protein
MKVRSFVIICSILLITSQAFALFDSEVSKAKDFMKAGMYPQAVSVLEKYINEEPTDAEAHYTLALCYLEQNNLSGAEERFASTVKLDADYGVKVAGEYKNKGLNSLHKGNVGLARDLFRNAIKYQPSLGASLAQESFTFAEKNGNASAFELAASMDPQYKQQGYDFFKHLGDSATDNDRKVRYYYEGAKYTGIQSLKEKMGLKIVKVAATLWPSKECNQYKKLAAELIAEGTIDEIFPGETTIVVFEKTYTNESADKKGNVPTFTAQEDGINKNDLIEVFAKRIDGKEFIPKDIWVSSSDGWVEVKNGYRKAWCDKPEGTCYLLMEN